MWNNSVREDEWDYSGKTEREIKRLNQLFSELEKGGDKPQPEPDNEPWKRDPDWAAFDAMPHPIYYDNGADNELLYMRTVDVMIKVIDESKTVALTYNTLYPYEANGRQPIVDWGDGTPAETLTSTYYSYNAVYRNCYQGSATHTYSEKGIYYIRFTKNKSAAVDRYSIAVCPAYGEGWYAQNPPLIIGYKYSSPFTELMIEGNCNNLMSPTAFPALIATTKFIQFSSDYLRLPEPDTGNSKIINFYNSAWIDCIKRNYTGINSEEDITDKLNA
jgi:hypothetical protein